MDDKKNNKKDDVKIDLFIDQSFPRLFRKSRVTIGTLPDIDLDEETQQKIDNYLEEKYGKSYCNHKDFVKNSAGGTSFKQCKKCKKDMGDWKE